MSGFIGNDGSALAGALNPSSVVNALNLDGSGNLKVALPNTPTTPTITESNISNWIPNGQGFSVALALTSGAAGVYAASIFNNSTSKNIWLYAISAYNQGGFNPISLLTRTTDPALGTAVTPVNHKLGGPASAIAANCSYETLPGGVAGTLLSAFEDPQSATYDFFDNGQGGVLLPANAANGVVVSVFVNAATNYGFVFNWVEY